MKIGRKLIARKMLVKLTPGVNFYNISLVLNIFWGMKVCRKAARKMLVKLTPGVVVRALKRMNKNGN
jgi:hypothetical protein